MLNEDGYFMSGTLDWLYSFVRSSAANPRAGANFNDAVQRIFSTMGDNISANFDGLVKWFKSSFSNNSNFLGEANYTKILMKQITIQNNLAKLSEKLQIEKLTNITSGLKSGASKVGDFFKSAGNAVKSAAGGAKKVVKGTKAVNRTGKKIQNGVNAVKSKASKIFGTVGESTDIDNCYSDLYSDIFGEKYDSSSEINDIDTMYSEFCNDILYNF